MIIRCPNCHFERDIPLSSIPQTAVMATCPRCKRRFSFRNTSPMPHASADGEVGPLQEKEIAAGSYPYKRDTLDAGSSAEPSAYAEDEAKAPLEGERPFFDQMKSDGQGKGLLQKPGESRPSTEAFSEVTADLSASKEAASKPAGSNAPVSSQEDDPLPPGAIVNPSPIEPVEKLSSKRKTREENKSETEYLQDAGDDRENRGDLSVPSDEEEQGTLEGYKTSVAPRLRGAAGLSESLAADVPWEKPRKYHPVSGFYRTLLRVMFHPVDFFLAVPKCRGTLTRPVAFYLILGMIQTIAQLFWIHVKIFPAMAGENVQVFWNSTATTFSLTILVKLFVLPIELYFYAALFFLMLRLVQPEKADFAVVLRVIAYSSAPLIFYLVPIIGQLVGAIWFAGCCFVGCRIALGLPWNKVAMALGPLYLIAFAIMAQLSQHLGII